MARAVLCPTPSEHCTGGIKPVNAAMRASGKKLHMTHEEAYACYRRYLVDICGCKDRGRREFSCPDKEGVVFLTSPRKFGEGMRLGKADRFMPDHRGGGAVIHT